MVVRLLTGGRGLGVALLAMLVLVGKSSAAANSSSVVARNATELMAALKDPVVTRIQLADGVVNLLDGVGSPVTLGANRKVEIVGSVRVLQQLDSGTAWLRPDALQYASGIDFGQGGSAGMIRLADNSSLAFVDLLLWHSLTSIIGYDVSVIALATPGAR